MQEVSRAKKKAVNLSIDGKLLEEAKAEGLNLSGILEASLNRELREVRKAKWQAENRDATESMNDYVRKHGLWSDKHRTW
jgi:antitoxin CcdA